MPAEADTAVWRVGERKVRATQLTRVYWPATAFTLIPVGYLLTLLLFALALFGS